MLKEIKKWKKENNKKYKELQAVFSYNSNRIEGNSLELAQVKKLAEGKILKSEVPGTAIEILKHLKLQDDIREAENHFRCFDYVIDTIDSPISHEWLFEHLLVFLTHGIPGIVYPCSSESREFLEPANPLHRRCQCH